MQPPHVSITKKDMETLRAFTRTGTRKAREISRAEILLMAYERMDEDRIAEHIRRHVRTVRRVVARYVQGGLARALYDAPRSGQPRKTTRKDDAHLIAVACSAAPFGSEHWTLELLQKQLRKDRGKKLGTTAIWLRLNAHDTKPWREKNVVRAET